MTKSLFAMMTLVLLTPLLAFKGKADSSKPLMRSKEAALSEDNVDTVANGVVTRDVAVENRTLETCDWHSGDTAHPGTEIAACQDLPATSTYPTPDGQRCDTWKDEAVSCCFFGYERDACARKCSSFGNHVWAFHQTGYCVCKSFTHGLHDNRPSTAFSTTALFLAYNYVFLKQPGQCIHAFPKSLCMSRSLCYDQFPESKINDKDWQCKCLYGDEPNDPLCTKWNQCISEKESTAANTYKLVTKAIQNLQTTNLLQIGEGDGGKAEAGSDCQNPTTMEIAAVECECGASFREECESKATPELAQDCWEEVLCSNAGVCQSWKDQYCSSLLLSIDHTQNVSDRRAEMRVLPTRGNDSQDGDASLDESLTGKRSC